jgi:hypothetical protein
VLRASIVLRSRSVKLELLFAGDPAVRDVAAHNQVAQD